MQVEIDAWLALGKPHARPSTIDAYRADLADYLAYVAERGAWAAVEAGDVTGYLAHASASGFSPATIRRRWVALRGFHAWLAVEEGIADPMIGLRLTSVRPTVPKILTGHEVDGILADRRRSVRDHAILMLLARCGLTASEITELRLADVDLVGHEVVIVGRRRRAIPLPADAQAAIALHLIARQMEARSDDNARCFASTGHDRMTRVTVTKIARTAGRLSGVPAHVTPSALRTACSVRLLEMGRTPNDIRRTLGLAYESLVPGALALRRA